MANGVEFLRYNGKDCEVHTGVRGGKHLMIDEKKRYLTKEHKEKIFVKEVEDLAEKLGEVVLEPEAAEVEAVAEEASEGASEGASEEEASEEASEASEASEDEEDEASEEE